MPAAHGYVRQFATDAEDGSDHAAALAEWESYYTTHLAPLGFERSRVWGDPPWPARPITRRRHGQWLDGRANKGDIVLMPRLLRSFYDAKDLVVTVDRWLVRGVDTIIPDIGLDTRTEAGRVVLEYARLFVQLGRNTRAEASKHKAASRIRDGRPWGHPPWGTHVTGSPGQRRFEAVPGYYELAKTVIALKEQGYSFKEIAAHLEGQGVTRAKNWTKKGYEQRVPWKKDTLGQAYPKMHTLVRRVESGELFMPKRRSARECPTQQTDPSSSASASSGSSWKPWA